MTTTSDEELREKLNELCDRFGAEETFRAALLKLFRPAAAEAYRHGQLDALQWVTGGLNNPEKTDDDWLLKIIWEHMDFLKAATSAQDDGGKDV